MSAQDVQRPLWLNRAGLQGLLDALLARGYRTLGPRVRDDAIVYDDLSRVDQLPEGWGDEQSPGRYRLRRRADTRLFGHVVGPHSWKRFLHQPEVTVAATTDGVRWAAPEAPTEKLALLGIRACELAAIHIQDRVLLGGPFTDPHYRRRREDVLFIGVNCTEPGGTCFCASMNTGPRHRLGHDIALTELDDGFVAEAATEEGRELLAAAGASPAPTTAVSAATTAVDAASGRMGRQLELEGLALVLASNLENPIWDEVASRCLGCANCTLTCPTCFCSTTVETSDLSGPGASRVRKWDSCFTADFSRVHGGNFRPATRDRYRQWMTHKLSSWYEQFGTSGCVGCGRCITWCPTGIDITREAQRIREAPMHDSRETAARIQANRRLLAASPTDPPPACRPSLEDGSMVPVPARVRAVNAETADTFTLKLELENPADRQRFGFEPGQFNMLSLPGVGECAISISSSPANHGQLSHTIRAVGSVTHALQSLTAGSLIGLRGPFGSSWPLECARGKDLLIVAGGIGLAPLRPALYSVMADRQAYGRVQLLYGARTPEDMLFARDLLAWSSAANGIEVKVTVDTAGPDWTGRVGVVTTLFKGLAPAPDARTIAMLCGPEVMMRFSVRDLLKLGLAPQDIHVSMERNMKCAVGFCGHCQYGPHFICKDGPVFPLPAVEHTFWKEGI